MLLSKSLTFNKMVTSLEISTLYIAQKVIFAINPHVLDSKKKIPHLKKICSDRVA